MNTIELEALRNAALALTESERARLASDLVSSLDGPREEGAAEAWDIEIGRRINEIDSGKATLLCPKEVISRARARIKS